MQPAGRAHHVVASATEQLEVCLGNIRLLAGMMLEEDSSRDRTENHDYLRAIERKASDLLNLTADLGDFAQMSLRKTALQRCEFRLSEVVEQAIEALTPLAAKKRRLLILAIGAGEPAISGDYRQLLRSFSALLRHSLHIAVPAAQVLVTLRPSAKLLRLEINVAVDTESAPRKTCDPLLGDSLDAASEDLSIAIAAQVIEMHGGTLRTLTGERHTRFAIELPVALS